MQKTKVCSYLIFLAAIALSQLGCAVAMIGDMAHKKYAVVYQHKDFKPQSPDVITVLPVADGRLIVKQGDNFEKKTKGLQKLITAAVKKKRYDCEAINNTNAMGGIHPSQIPFLEANQVRKIGSGNSGWILVPVVDDLGKSLLFEPGITRFIPFPHDADMTCYLFEKRTGKLMWEGSATYSTLKGAASDLMDSFPARK